MKLIFSAILLTVFTSENIYAQEEKVVEPTRLLEIEANKEESAIEKISKFGSLSLNIDTQSHFFHIENNYLLPESSSYDTTTYPFLGYKLDVLFRKKLFGINLSYADTFEGNNLKTDFINSDEVVDHYKSSKTARNVFDLIMFIPFLPQKNLAFYTEYESVQFQTKFEVKNTLFYGENSLKEESYYYTNIYDNFSLGLQSSSEYSNIKLNIAAGFSYSTLLMPYYTEDPDTIQSSTAKRYNIFIKHELQNKETSDFFEVAGYGMRADIGLGNTEDSMGNDIIISNEDNFIHLASKTYSDFYLFDNCTLSLASGTNTMNPAGTWEEVSFGIVAPLLLAMTSYTMYKIDEVHRNNGYLQEKGSGWEYNYDVRGLYEAFSSKWGTLFKTLSWPLINYGISKLIDNDSEDTLQRELYYGVHFTFRF